MSAAGPGWGYGLSAILVLCGCATPGKHKDEIAPAEAIARQVKEDLARRRELSEETPVPLHGGFAEETIEVAPGLLTRFYHIRYVPGAELIPLITPWLTPDKGKVVNHPGLDQLIITDTVESLARLEQFLALIDAQTNQVEIEAQVAEVRRSNLTELGLKYAESRPHRGSLRSVTGFFNTAGDILQDNAATPRKGVEAIISTRDRSWIVDLTLRALVDKGYADILASPRILVRSGQTAEINTVTDVPILSETIQENRSRITIAPRSVGVKLKVKPTHIGSEGVLLEVNPDVSAVSGFTEPAVSGGFAHPIVTVRSAVTTVNIRDGQTLVIGGLINRQIVHNTRGIPILSDIPIIGYAFQSKDKKEEETEIVILLSIHILRPEGPGLKLHDPMNTQEAK